MSASGSASSGPASPAGSSASTSSASPAGSSAAVSVSSPAVSSVAVFSGAVSPSDADVSSEPHAPSTSSAASSRPASRRRSRRSVISFPHGRHSVNSQWTTPMGSEKGNFVPIRARRAVTRNVPMNTDLTLLRAFVEVARCSGFGRAAELLHLDPSTVSRQVAQLERRLGVKLFERTTRQVWVTDAGRALLPRAEDVLRAADIFDRTAEAVDRQTRGELVVGFQVHAINATVLGWVADAESTIPGLTVRLQEGNFADPSTGLRDRSCDLAFVFLPFDTDGIETAPLYDLPWLMFLPATHRLATQASVRLEECWDEPWGCAASDDRV